MQTIVNLGTGGADLNGQNGSTTSADSNDALFLDWPGDNAGNYVYFAGGVANNMSVTDEAALDITGDIDIRIHVAMDDWTTFSGIVAKYAAGQYSWAVLVTSGGNPQFRWSADGSSALSKTATAAVPFADGEAGWIRIALDVDNGASGNDVKFYTSTDGSSWTQLGSTVTTAGVTSIFAGTANILWSNFIGVSFAGKLYRTQILNGIDGTTVLDVDTSVITSGSATSFTALTGQTVTINRSTSGRKSVAVVSPVWLFGTDDYMEVADNALLDFGASDDFTIVYVGRIWSTPASTARGLQKGPGPSYSFRNQGTNAAMTTHVSDGVNATSAAASYTFGAVSVIAGVIDRTAQTMLTNVNGLASSPVSISAVGSLQSTAPLRINTVPAAYLDSEMISVLVFRRALSVEELSQIQAYYQARLS